MVKINKFYLLIAATILLNIALVNAAPFDVNVTPINDKIVVNEVAEFDINIRNNLDTNEEFTIKKAGYPFWDMYTKPLQSPITLKVPSHSSASIRLFVEPLYITSVDTYTLHTSIILERLGQEQKVPVTIGIKSTEPLISGYIPTVLAIVDVPEKIDPREKTTIKITLNNQNPINYTNLTIKIESNLIKGELYTDLGPKEEKTVEVAKEIDALTPPQEDRLVVAIFLDKRVIVNPFIKEFAVIEYVTKEELQEQKSLLKTTKGVKVLSNNPDYKGQLKVETTLLKNLFSSSEPRAELVKEDGKYYLVWDIEVGNDNISNAYVTENYRLLVVIIALVITAIALYFLFRSPIVVRKGIANVGFSEGGVSDAKVVVRVKNRSGSQITNIEVVDHVPHIAHVEKELSIGSMQPHAVLQHPKGGLVIKWTVEVLEPGDERVLSYRMKSRLPILGEFNLPAASARCKIGEKVVISNSNRISVGG